MAKLDPSMHPNADDDYTLAQRRVLDARLDESENELKDGRTAGPFNSADDMIANIKGKLGEGGAASTKNVRI